MKNREKYEPYNLESLKQLMKFFYTQGWYSGTKDLLTITMMGGFEAFSGRATETWEHQFKVKNCAIPELKIPEQEATGRTLDIACENLIMKLMNSE